MINNPLSNLKIDKWYKILPVIGAVILILSLTIEMKVADNFTIMIISIGTIFIGIGEWINHPLQTRVGVGFKIISYNRVNNFWGNLWGLVGLLMIFYTLFNYF